MRVMHKSTPPNRPHAVYHERLSPSLWVLVAAAVSAPMVALVFAPVDATLALVAGVGAGVAVVAALVLASPTISVVDGELRVGRAHVPIELLGEPEALVGEAAAQARGPGLSRTAWHTLRGGIDGVVRVPLHDADDPVSEWVFSSRTPDRVARVISRARAAR